MNRVLYKALSSAQVPLIVAHDSKKMADIKLRRYRDEKANTSLLINATVQPFSPLTGNPLTPELDGTVTIKASDVQALVPFAENKDLGVTYRTSASIADVLNGKGAEMFCAIDARKIGVKVHQKALAAALEADDSEEEFGGDPLDNEFPDATGEGADDAAGMAADDTLTDPEAAPTDDVSAVPPTEDVSDDAVAADPAAEAAPPPVEGDPAAAAPVDGENLDFPEEDPSFGDDAAAAEAEATADPNLTDLNSADSINNGGRVSNDTSLAAYRINLLEETASAEEKPVLHVAQASDEVYYVFANARPVAILSKTDASEGVKKIFQNSPRVVQAFLDSVEASGFSDQVVADFGVKPITIEVKDNDVIHAEVTAAVQAAEARFEQKKAELDGVLRQSLSIAAVAMNKGFYKDKPNPVRVALCKSLADNGVRNPEQIVDAAFADHGEDYLRSMMEQAFALAQDSNETRNKVAKLVEEASFQPTNVVVASSERAVARMTHGNTPALETTASEVPAPTPASNDVQALRQRLGLIKRR